jgi:hypothetical protein
MSCSAPVCLYPMPSMQCFVAGLQWSPMCHWGSTSGHSGPANEGPLTKGESNFPRDLFTRILPS